MPTFSLSSFTFIKRLFSFLFTFCHKGGVICISEVFGISPDNLDSSLCFIQLSVSHDVLSYKLNKQGDNIQPWHSFPYLEAVCSMSSSNCCFLTCIQISQEAGQVAWYSYHFKNFPQFVVIHTVKGFGIVNKAKVHVFLELALFRPPLLCILNLSPSPIPTAVLLSNHHQTLPVPLPQPPK